MTVHNREAFRQFGKGSSVSQTKGFWFWFGYNLFLRKLLWIRSGFVEKGINRALKARISAAHCQDRTAPARTSNRAAHAPHCPRLAPLPAPCPRLETPGRRKERARGCRSSHRLRGSAVRPAPGCPRRAEGPKFGHFGRSGRGVPAPLHSRPRTRCPQCRGAARRVIQLARGPQPPLLSSTSPLPWARSRLVGRVTSLRAPRHCCALPIPPLLAER